MMSRMRRVLLATGLALPIGGAAQPPPTLLESYARVTALQSYMTGHVGELLLACAEKNAITEGQAEARYQAYRQRNAALLDRADAWSKDAEKRLQAQGDEHEARRLAQDADLTAMAAASARAQGLIDKARDTRAACEAVMAAIDAGRYDLSGNAEFVNLLKTKP
jgi:hypothetical protein